MPQYSKQDLKYASEFREGIHKEALEIIRKTRPSITEVIDRHPVEDYFQEHWDYPGRWYTIVAIPYGYKGRKDLVAAIVRDTLTGIEPTEHGGSPSETGTPARRAPGRQRLSNQLEVKPFGYRELFVVDVDPQRHSARAVGVDAEGRYILEHCEEYDHGGAIGSTVPYDVLTRPAYRRHARLALLNGQVTQEQYDALLAQSALSEKQET